MIDREVIVIVEVGEAGRPSIVRRRDRTWYQHLSPDMIREIGPSRRALYLALHTGDHWMFGKRADITTADLAKSALR